MWDQKQPLDDYLEHYGVLGMKWGVRNNTYSSIREGGAKKLKKIEKYQGKSAKNKAKAAKIQYNIARQEYKTQKLIKRGEEPITRLDKKQVKATKANAKAIKYDHKVAKLERRVTKAVERAMYLPVDMQAANRYEHLFDRRVGK